MSAKSLRDAFDESASVYQSARPAYPAELYDDLAELTTISPTAHLLEIGAASGTATVELARRGYRITAVELGPDLADQTRRNVAAYPEVSVITSGFEEWQPPTGVRYDLICAANSWQWLDQDLRWAKAADLLEPGGCLAIFGASHAFPEGFDPIFTELQAVYDKLGEGVGDWPPPPPRLKNARLVDEGVASGRFRAVARRMYVWPLRYDADSYLRLLDTFANHIVMEPAKRDRLSTEVRDLLAARPDGRLTRHWLAQLAVLRRT